MKLSHMNSNESKLKTNGNQEKIKEAIFDCFLALADIIKADRAFRDSASAATQLIPQRVNHPIAAGQAAMSGVPTCYDDFSRLSVRSPAGYDDSIFQRLWRPGRCRSIYVAGCQGAYHISEAIGRKVFKIGSASPHRLTDRIKEIGRCQYSAVIEGTDRIEPGFDSWSLCRIGPQPHFKPKIPIEFLDFEWRVQLPASMSDAHFEDSLRQVLEPINLRTWARSLQGQDYLKARGVDSDICSRETHYQNKKSPCDGTLYFLREN